MATRTSATPPVTAPYRWLEPVNPLTHRELDLLALLPTPLTNTELAERLFVSVNTVKSHLKSIYRKLDVDSRDNAVARARRLGLLRDNVRRCGCGTGWIIDSITN